MKGPELDLTALDPDGPSGIEIKELG